jgi:hypothetical protein
VPFGGVHVNVVLVADVFAINVIRLHTFACVLLANDVHEALQFVRTLRHDKKHIFFAIFLRVKMMKYQHSASEILKFTLTFSKSDENSFKYVSGASANRSS